MRHWIAYSILILVSATTSWAADSTELERAKAATGDFAAALKSELMNAMQNGGPLAAIDACHLKAPGISAGVSQHHGLQIYRVSSRNRNPANAPNDWQSAVLATFESRKKAGEDPAALIWHTKVELENATEFRFMKAIPTGGLCLQCHGTHIAEPVAERLAQLYPQDKATGFSSGDLRGAFVVTRRIEPE